jgi:murein DD-endopeptidase MepM/ murein hydrolase activator NlpD
MLKKLLWHFLSGFLAFVFVFHKTDAKTLPSKNYPLSKKGRFLFPINPGKPASLTGNMGEIRSNHFHGGLDIRTGWASGLPVFAAKEGYVSRVLMAGEGYGNTLFITHPDGFVTVYAHLESLSQPLHDYVKRQQYELKSFEIDLNFRKDVFRVKQGDTVAISGNTGSSRGPHLHFEIRDTAGITYNPLAFGFEEVKDNLPPVADRLALYPLDIHGRINGKYERTEIQIREAGKEFIATSIPEISGTIGLEIKARDRINNGTSNGGIYCIEMFLDDKLIYFHNLNQFPYQKTNHVNQLINYRHFRLSGEKFQKLYSPDGYFQSAFMPRDQKGKISIPPGKISLAEIHLWDVYGNKRVCKIRLKGAENKTPAMQAAKPAERLKYDVMDNTLVITTNGQGRESSELLLFREGKPHPLLPAVVSGNEYTYLHDLRKMLPDSAVLTDKAKIAFSFVAGVSPAEGGSFSLPGVGITIPPGILFDTLYLEAKKEEKDLVRINSSLIPLTGMATISQTCAACPRADSARYRAYAEAMSGTFNKSLYTERRNGNLFFNSKYLGRFKTLKDSTPPVIKMGICNESWAKFNVYDNLSGLHKMDAYLNGEWILMVWDKKQNLLYADPWHWQKPMRGEFKLVVSDQAGNVSTFTRQL